ncbi:MAG: RluA family pseudouridine synthase [Phycisphaerales bacterium]|nr:MAG: RluA family pseudouridine synthase [Phycisphaerales bacterium]
MEVVFANDDFVVLNKPSGLLSVPGRGEEKADCLASRAQAMFPHATGPLTVHRLDMETSGLTVLALHPEAHVKLSRQFNHRKVKKNYVALLAGTLDASLSDEGCVELPLVVDWPNRPRHMVDFERGKPAKTYYTVLERLDRHPDYPNAGPLTRVRFRPITGRTHQLRLHAAHPPDLAPDGTNRGGLGLPILADPLYSDTRAHAPRLMLHATLLCFWDPAGGSDWLRFESQEPF